MTVTKTPYPCATSSSRSWVRWIRIGQSRPNGISSSSGGVGGSSPTVGSSAGGDGGGDSFELTKVVFARLNISLIVLSRNISANCNASGSGIPSTSSSSTNPLQLSVVIAPSFSSALCIRSLSAISAVRSGPSGLSAMVPSNYFSLLLNCDGPWRDISASTRKCQWRRLHHHFTGSYPPLLHGLQRKILQTPRMRPRATPYLSTASYIYCEQLG